MRYPKVKKYYPGLHWWMLFLQGKERSWRRTPVVLLARCRRLLLWHQLVLWVLSLRWRLSLLWHPWALCPPWALCHR